MTVYFLSRDDIGTMHIVTKHDDGIFKGACGSYTGTPDFYSHATKAQLLALIHNAPSGCDQCVTALTTKKVRTP